MSRTPHTHSQHPAGTPCRRPSLLLVGVVLAAACAGDGAHSASSPPPASVPLIGRACEGCEAAFDGMPSAPPTHLRLRAATGPGEPLTLSGTVRDAHGNPRPGIVLYLHQTDHTGLYPPLPETASAGPDARRHGALRGWVATDARGRYVVETMRPGGYPGTDIPQHIHIQVIEPGCFTYFIDDVMFRDDPRLTPRQERQLAFGAGGNGIVTPQRVDGAWHATRDIVLGAEIPGYRPCLEGGA